MKFDIDADLFNERFSVRMKGGEPRRLILVSGRKFGDDEDVAQVFLVYDEDQARALHRANVGADEEPDEQLDEDERHIVVSTLDLGHEL
mgnify:CR=1 FL=1